MVDLIITRGGYDYCYDWSDQRIDIDATLDQVDVVDLWRTIQEAQASEIGISYPIIATASGLDELSPGVSTFLTVRLLGSWEINTLKSSGQMSVGGGNLIRDDGADPFRDNPLITYINNLSQAGTVSIAETGVSGLTPDESADLALIDTVHTLVQQVQTLTEELHRLQGLDAAAPMTVTPTGRTAGSIEQLFTGDGETSTTVTRVDP